MYGVLGTLDGKQNFKLRTVTKKKKRVSRTRRCCRWFGTWCRNWCDKTNKTLLVLGAILGLPTFYMTLWLLLSPGLSTLTAGFHPASCTVASSVILEGTKNCTWSSCRQGCTEKELYVCWQIFVFVQVVHGNTSTLEHLHGNLDTLRPLPVPVTSLTFTRNESKKGQVKEDEDNLNHGNLTHLRRLPIPVTSLSLTRNHSGDEQMKENEGNFTFLPVTSLTTLPLTRNHSDDEQVEKSVGNFTFLPVSSSTTPSTSTQESQEPKTHSKGAMDDLKLKEMGLLLPKGPGSLTQLHVNVEGCGYDPCEPWWQLYGRLGSTYACYLSADGSVAVPEIDLKEAKAKVVLGMLPLILMTVAVVVLYVFYFPKKKKMKSDNHPAKQQEVKWEQARHLILRQIEKKHQYMQFDPILVKAALARNQVAPSNLPVKGDKKKYMK